MKKNYGTMGKNYDTENNGTLIYYEKKPMILWKKLLYYSIL